MPKLILMQDGQSVDIPLDRQKILLGRLPECDIRLNSNMVSRRHAEITIDGSEVAIADLGSGNGTYLNGNRLGEGQSILTPGDRVKLGPILIRVEDDGPPADERAEGTHVVNKLKIVGRR